MSAGGVLCRHGGGGGLCRYGGVPCQHRILSRADMPARGSIREICDAGKGY